MLTTGSARQHSSSFEEAYSSSPDTHAPTVKLAFAPPRRLPSLRPSSGKAFRSPLTLDLSGRQGTYTKRPTRHAPSTERAKETVACDGFTNLDKALNMKTALRARRRRRTRDNPSPTVSTSVDKISDCMLACAYTYK